MVGINIKRIMFLKIRMGGKIIHSVTDKSTELQWSVPWTSQLPLHPKKLLADNYRNFSDVGSDWGEWPCDPFLTNKT